MQQLLAFEGALCMLLERLLILRSTSLSFSHDLFRPTLRGSLQVHDWQSVYQSKDIPIPRFPPVDGSVNFIGRLAREIMRQTAPSLTTYIEQKHAWYDPRTQQEVMQSGMFTSMHAAVGTFGLSGLDRLLSFMAVKELQTFQQTHLRVVQSDKAMLAFHAELNKSIRPVTGVPSSTKVRARNVDDYGLRRICRQQLTSSVPHCRCTLQAFRKVLASGHVMLTLF